MKPICGLDAFWMSISYGSTVWFDPSLEKCIMNDICPEEKRNLKPPKSISIKGMTGWESEITDDGGGGGIMA